MTRRVSFKAVDLTFNTKLSFTFAQGTLQSSPTQPHPATSRAQWTVLKKEGESELTLGQRELEGPS